MMKRKTPLIQSEVIRNASVLLSGNALGQVIAFLVTMILTRIYSKDDFGVFALFMSTATILSYLTTGRYEEANVLIEKEKDSQALTGFILRWNILFSASLFLFLFFFHRPLFSVLNMKSLTDFWILLPFMIFLIGMSNTLNFLANREKRFKSIAGANLTQNTSSALTKIALKPLLPNAWGLLAGQLISYACSFAAFYKLKGFLKKAIRSEWKDQKAVIHTYKNFPKYVLPRNVINSISANLPFFLLTDVFGTSVLGLFFLAFNTAYRPINLVVNSFYQVFYKKATQLKQDKEKISSLIYSYWKHTILYILPFFIILFFFAPALFGFFFGENWQESGIYLRYILLWLFLVLLTNPMEFVPLVFGKQRTYMIIEIFYFIFRILAILIGIKTNDFHLAIRLFAAVGVVFMSIFFIWYYRTIHNYEKNL